LVLVGKARIPSDHEQPANAREGGDDLLDHPVSEIFLLRIAAQVVERQHGERGLVCNRQAPPWSRIRVVGYGRFSRTQEPIAALGDSDDPASPIPVFVECFAQRRDVHLNVVFLDDDPGPHPLHQLVFADDFALGRGQYAEDVERPAAEAHQGLIAPQLAPREVKSEPAEADLPLDHGDVPLENN